MDRGFPLNCSHLFDNLAGSAEQRGERREIALRPCRVALGAGVRALHASAPGVLFGVVARGALVHEAEKVRLVLQLGRRADAEVQSARGHAGALGSPSVGRLGGAPVPPLPRLGAARPAQRIRP